MRRLTLELADTVRDRIDQLQALSEATSASEVIRRAVAVYEVVLRAELAGDRLEIRAADGSMRQLVVR